MHLLHIDSFSYKISQEVLLVYNDCLFQISNFHPELESLEYQACKFQLNDASIVYRASKITPKKVGQFVTFWKRKTNDPIEPFNDNDVIDFFVVTVTTESQLGQFVFPKSILKKKGILTSDKKEGKRAFRVYPPWDIACSKQAIATQKWQLDYFYEINKSVDLNLVKALFKNNK